MKKKRAVVRAAPPPKAPKVLDEIVDKVLRFKPAPRSKAAMRRAAKAAEIEIGQRRRVAD